MVKAKAIALMFIMSLSVGQAYAYNCNNLAPYTSSTYATGNLVSNVGHAYRCSVGGWCTVGGPYEPGVGWAWQHAWSDLGACDNSSSVSSSSLSSSAISSSLSSSNSSALSSAISSSSAPASSSSFSTNSSFSNSSASSTGNCPAYAAGTSYQAGNVVANAGGFFACSVPGWCSSGNAAYEPGVGWAQAQAWSPSTASACGGGSGSSSSNGSNVPDVGFCAEEFTAGKIYTAGSHVAYQGAVYRALVDTHSIHPGNTAYPGQWSAAVGYADPDMCPVPIPNTINYGTPQPVSGNPNTGIVNPTGAIAAARISSTQSTLPGQQGGIAPATDNGGDHGGLDGDNGARVSKLVPGNLTLQHNTYNVTAGTEIVTYIGDWAVYGRRFDFTKLAASNLNRIVYGFAGICYPGASNVQDGGFPTSAPAAVMRNCTQSYLPDGAMALADFEAAFVRNVGVAPQGVVGTESQYELDPDNVGGVFGVLYQLREQNPNLKLDLSVGGWTLSEGFYWMAGNPTRRKAFVDSIVHFLERFDFDGVDIDWEYPATDGSVPGVSSPADDANYAALIQELRAGMDWLSNKTGKPYRLSSAIPAGLGRLEKINWDNVHPYMDRLYLMTYDLTGAWEREISHHTPLYTNPNAVGSSAGTSADWTINYMKSLGVPANKLMIGAANYHRAKATVPGDISEYTNGVIGSTTYGDLNWTGANQILGIAGVGSWEAGVVEGYDLFQNFLDRELKPRNGYTLYTDKAANADYLVHEGIGSFISIETPRTVALKTQYAKDNGLAGIFFWMAEQDNGYNLNTVNHVLGNPLISNKADATPQNQIPVCGKNLTAQECEALISPLR
jgi:chitinase